MLEASALLAVLLLSDTALAIIHPLNEESINAYFREQAAANYARLVSEKIDSLRNINGLILDNPSIYQEDTMRVVGYFISLLQPMYITIIIVIGIYLMFSQGPLREERGQKRTHHITICNRPDHRLTAYTLAFLFRIKVAHAYDPVPCACRH